MKPVAAGTTQTLTANFVQPVQWAKYKVYTVNTNGTRGTLLYTSPTQSDVQSISGTYSFTSAGLYEVEFEVVDCSVSGTTITGSMRVRVK